MSKIQKCCHTFFVSSFSRQGKGGILTGSSIGYSISSHCEGSLRDQPRHQRNKPTSFNAPFRWAVWTWHAERRHQCLTLRIPVEWWLYIVSAARTGMQWCWGVHRWLPCGLLHDGALLRCWEEKSVVFNKRLLIRSFVKARSFRKCGKNAPEYFSEFSQQILLVLRQISLGS